MSGSTLIRNSHNVSDIFFSFIYPTKYRYVVLNENVDENLKQICVGIKERHDWIIFFEIGTDKNYVFFDSTHIEL